jgi:hypothetical protein
MQTHRKAVEQLEKLHQKTFNGRSVFQLRIESQVPLHATWLMRTFPLANSASHVTLSADNDLDRSALARVPSHREQFPLTLIFAHASYDVRLLAQSSN